MFGLGSPIVNRLRTTQADTTPALAPAPIDGARAYGYLKQICAIGPRPAGSAANARQRQMVAQHFTKYGATVREQPFSGVDPQSGAKVDDGQPDRRLASRADPAGRARRPLRHPALPRPRNPTRPAARLPFIGANDGGSGVALLMEIAHHLKDLPTTWGVDLVLFDGEELVYGRERRVLPRLEGIRPGLRRERRVPPGGPRYVAAIVLDMIGDKNLAIEQEQYSLNFAPGLVQEVWSVARRLKATAFRNRVGPAVTDDHLPLNNAGIPAIDLIDFRTAPHLAHGARPARAVLGRQPRTGRQGRHRLAVAAPEQESLKLTSRPTRRADR